MSLARLVVVEGPDAGRDFELPMRGGMLGRAEGSLVQLTDPLVSREHAEIALVEGALVWWTCAGRSARINGALVDGASGAVDGHRLAEGDEIIVGNTRLAYLPDRAVAMTNGASHVTMEVGSRALLAIAGQADRAHRQLAAIAQLGDRLRAETGGSVVAIARAVAEAAQVALAADRVFVVHCAPPYGGAARSGAPDLAIAHGRRESQLAAAVADGESTQLQAPVELVDKVVRERHVVTAETSGRALIAAPIHGAGEVVAALLWADRAGSAAWADTDALAAASFAHLAGAAWAGQAARDELARKVDALEEQVAPLAGGDFLGTSTAAQRVLELIARVAATDTTVLLGGESGSGKEMVARAIHKASRRARGPCVAVNCAALTETLIESELFGHDKGAFTGASERKAGRFELADRGTLFLDEIGELPLALQTKFLRVLEERRFERVGGQRAIEVDVRVIAATNRDLQAMVARGAFREDLYYRLAVIQVDVPPLRERVADIPLLAEHFLARLRAQVGRRIAGFAPDALVAMQRYRWPGNVRELRNAVERAVVLGTRDRIHADDLPPQVIAAAADVPARRSGVIVSPTPLLGTAASSASIPVQSPTPTPTPVPTPVPFAPARSLRELEKDGILAALAATHGNKAAAAALLEIDRSTLYKKLKDYGIGD